MTTTNRAYRAREAQIAREAGDRLAVMATHDARIAARLAYYAKTFNSNG